MAKRVTAEKKGVTKHEKEFPTGTPADKNLLLFGKPCQRQGKKVCM